jgi:hypothetical protein
VYGTESEMTLGKKRINEKKKTEEMDEEGKVKR